ncbi:MAG TPA: hypothetical protein VL086_14630 [Candidatus Nitrosotalea sp.]|jgi:hypothetical protein|nr:hypothetical protein [Candidatus Nitrosotalea sp.]
MRSIAPTWIEPGASATLIWHGAVASRPGDGRLYSLSGPAFERPPASPYFLLAPVEAGAFAGRLYRGQVALPELRTFLLGCRIARGALVDEMQYVLAAEEAPVLPLLDAWLDAAAAPALPYLDDINAFMPASAPLYVTADAHAAARREPEQFATAWVCDECGDAEDAGTFFWTAHREDAVRVCFLIQNDAGAWTCRLHPFEFAKESA